MAPTSMLSPASWFTPVQYVTTVHVRERTDFFMRCSNPPPRCKAELRKLCMQACRWVPRLITHGLIREHIICSGISITNQLKMTLESWPFKMKAKNISTYKPFNGEKNIRPQGSRQPSRLREVDAHYMRARLFVGTLFRGPKRVWASK